MTTVIAVPAPAEFLSANDRNLPSLQRFSRYNENGRRGAGNTADGLTHSSDSSREGLA